MQPAEIDPQALHFSRLAMATLTPQTFEILNDGALYDPHLYAIFLSYRDAVEHGDSSSTNVPNARGNRREAAQRVCVRLTE